MKNFVVAIFILTFSILSFSADKKCSSSNLEKLLSLSAKMIGELGQFSMDAAKIFSSSESENPKEMKVKFYNLKNTMSERSAPHIEAIDALLKKHPECDKEHNFTLKK